MIETKNMQALQLTQPRHFVLKTVPIPPVGFGQAIISFGYAALCGSDYPKYTGEWLGIDTPLSVGMPIHECVGQVVESSIPNLNPGTWVLAMPKNNCGLSDFFLADSHHIIPLIGWTLDNLYLATLGQPTSTVLHALDRVDSVTNKTILIVGLGGIGLIFCTLLQKMGASEIIGIEPNDFRRELANRLFKVKVFSEWSDELDSIADLSIEAVGHNLQSKTLSSCVNGTRPYGKIIIFGAPTISMQHISIEKIYRKNLTLIGSVNPDWVSLLPRGTRIVKEQLELFKSFITHRFHWEDAHQAFQSFENPKINRVKILLYANSAPS